MVFEKLHTAFLAASLEWDFSLGAQAVPADKAKAVFEGISYLFYNQAKEEMPRFASLDYRLEFGERFTLTREGNEKAILRDGQGKQTRLDTPGTDIFGVPFSVFKETVLVSPKEKNAHYGERVIKAGERALAYGGEELEAVLAEEALLAIKEQIFGKEEGKGALAALEKEREKTEAACQRALEDSALRLQEENQALRLKKKIEEAATEHEKFRRLISDFHESETIAAFDALHIEEGKAEKKAEELQSCIKAHTHNGFCPDAGYLFDLISAKNRLEKASVAYEEARAALRDLYALPPAVTQEEENLLSLLQRAGMSEAGERVRALGGKKKRSMVLGSLLLGAVGAMLGLLIGFFVRGDSSLGFLSLVGLLFLMGGAVAFWFEAYKTGKRMQAICQFCLAQDASSLALRTREAEDVLARIERRREKTFQTENAFYRASEDMVSARLGFAVLTAKYGYEAMEGDYAESFQQLSAHVDEYLKQVSSLQAEKELIDNKVRNMRNRLSGIGEVAVRARLSPPDRVRLRKLKESDLLQGAAYYQRQMEELREKEKRLEVNRYAERSEREAAERAAEAYALKEKEASLAARGAAAEEAARIIQEAREAFARREEERRDAAARYYREENGGDGLSLGIRLAFSTQAFLEKPPLFFTDVKDREYAYAAEKWGETGQAILFD